MTDQSPGLIAGLGALKSSGVIHGETLWDTFHVLKNYKFKNAKLKRHIMFMVRERCQHKFHRLYLEAIQLART